MNSHKVLFVASEQAHFDAFHTPYLQYFKENGYEVSTAARGESTIACVDRHYDICFERSPYSLKNIGCYKVLKKLIDENGYQIIHCHTPVASVLTRLAARKAREKGTAVIYTAHGFHFYQGAPFIAGLVFRIVEKWLSQFTDHLITINDEDYHAVGRYRFKAGAYYKVSGVGVDPARFAMKTSETKTEIRLKHSIPQQAYVLIFAAEYCKRKNQKMLFEAVSLLRERLPQTLLLLPGDGYLRTEYEQMIRSMGIENNVWLMGFRNDMESLLPVADVAVASSIQEGLPINVVEAMMMSLPVVATDIRGHIDLITDSKNGFLVPINDAKTMAERLLLLYEKPDIAQHMSLNAYEMVKPYLWPNAKMETCKIYDKIITAIKETT